MASEPDEAGPSGLTAEEILTLLHLDTLDSEKEETAEKDPLLCPEEMGDSDEDEVCQEALDPTPTSIHNPPP